MAVTMSTGGYCRSDFMISDAAIPMRLEELEAEQSEKFAEILGSFGTAESSAQQDIPCEENAALLEKAASDEAADIPEELLAEEGKMLLNAMETARTEKADAPENKSESGSDEREKTVGSMAVNAAMVIDNAAAELSEIAAFGAAETTVPPVGENPNDMVVEQAEPIAEQPMAQQLFPTDSVSAEKQTETAVNTVPEQAAQQVFAEQPETFGNGGRDVRKTDVFVDTTSAKSEDIPSEIPAVTQAGQLQKQDMQQNPNDTGSSELARTLGTEKAQALAKAAENGEISRPEVRKFTETDEQAQANTEQTSASPLRNRVKSASEELEMLRSAKTADHSEKPQAQTEQPVQQPLQQAVTVHTDSGTVEVKREEIVRQAAELVKTAVTEHTGDPEKTEYSLTLDPEELGKITVKLSKAADGAVSVTIAAEKSATQRILEQNGALIQDSLKNSGVKLESWQTVGESQQEHYAQDYNGSSKNPYHREEPQHKPDDGDDTSFAELITAM